MTLVLGGASTQRGCESGRGGGGDVLRSYELAARTAEADPPEPLVAAAAPAQPIEEAPADPLAEFATAMSEPAAAVVDLFQKLGVLR